MIDYKPIYGVITSIEPFWTNDPKTEGCYQMMTLQLTDGNIIHFVVSPNTYFVNQYRMMIGDWVVAFYDGNAPVPLIYPPQYRALIVSPVSPSFNIKVDYFNQQLISRDGLLQLNLSPFTETILKNNQLFTGSLTNKQLIVIYGATTRSIPAQTTPLQIIVLCDE